MPLPRWVRHDIAGIWVAFFCRYQRYRCSQAPGINLGNMIYSGQRIEGFVCTPWLSGQQGNFLEDMSGWIKEGWMKVEETYFEGAEAYGDGFQSLFTGGNYGKVVVTTRRAKM